MPNLFPTANSNFTEIKNTEIENEFETKSSFAIDFENKRLKRNSFGVVERLTPYETYKQWCQIAVDTARNVYGAYSANFGIDKYDKSLKKEAVQQDIAKKITECLMANPCTTSVYGFSFTWIGTDCYIKYYVNNTFQEIIKLTTRV